MRIKNALKLLCYFLFGTFIVFIFNVTLGSKRFEGLNYIDLGGHESKIVMNEDLIDVDKKEDKSFKLQEETKTNHPLEFLPKIKPELQQGQSCTTIKSKVILQRLLFQNFALDLLCSHRLLHATTM